MAGKPAARMVYHYDGKLGRIQEESITWFGAYLTLQFICEMPANKADEYAAIFKSILESFLVGRPEPV